MEVVWRRIMPKSTGWQLDLRRSGCCISALTLIVLSSQCQAQAPAATPAGTFDLDKDREAMVLLDGQWRFQPGDDPDGKKGWANPSFDDSKWPLISSEKPWSEQGFKDMGGTAWYRVKVLIPEGEKPLSLYIPPITTNYQVFADGIYLGGLGDMPPHEHAYTSVRRVYELPQPTSSGARTLLIAIRIWHWPRWAKFNGGGLAGSLRIGGTRQIRSRTLLRNHESAWFSLSHVFLGILDVLAGLAAVSFFVFRPREREYLWFGVISVLSAAQRFLLVYTSSHSVAFEENSLTMQLLDLGQRVASVAFYYRLLEGKRDKFFLLAMGSLAAIVPLLSVERLGLVSVALWRELFTVLCIPAAVWVLALLTRRAIQGLPDARVLLVPVLFQQLIRLAEWIILIVQATGWYSIPSAWFNFTVDWPFPFTFDNLADALFLAAMLAILITRYMRTRKDEERYKREREAAQIVQQVLIPEEIPAIPGFSIQSVYKPFGEVGGDFFQIVPTCNGGALIAIGDVSGKGLPAAMTVSLLVGTFRTLARYTQEPGEILSAMNVRMLARSNGGFTTCLVLRADLDGRVTIANAGHIAPYVNGNEISLDSGLPLGLSAETVYQESAISLVQHDRLTLVTDGVVEARSKTGELFGFERMQTIVHQDAEFIARIAQEFGQDDDITAVSLSYTPLTAAA